MNFFTQPENYGLIKTYRLSEYFVNLQKYIVNPTNKKGLGKAEMFTRTQKAFALIKAHILDKAQGGKGLKSHTAIRKLKEIFETPKAYIELDTSSFDVRRPEKFDHEKILDTFDSALDIVKFDNEKRKPLKLIKSAISALDSIDVTSEFFSTSTVNKELEKLSNIVNDLIQNSSS